MVLLQGCAAWPVASKLLWPWCLTPCSGCQLLPLRLVSLLVLIMLYHESLGLPVGLTGPVRTASRERMCVCISLCGRLRSRASEEAPLQSLSGCEGLSGVCGPNTFKQGIFLTQPWSSVPTWWTGFPGKPVGMKNPYGFRASKCACQSNSKFLGTRSTSRCCGGKPSMVVHAYNPSTWEWREGSIDNLKTAYPT